MVSVNYSTAIQTVKEPFSRPQRPTQVQACFLVREFINQYRAHSLGQGILGLFCFEEHSLHHLFNPPSSTAEVPSQQI